MGEQCQIVVIGSINVDVSAYVADFPVVGQTIPAKQSLTTLGGKGLNQAVAASRAGAQVVMVAAVGDDHYGAMAIEFLIENNVDVSHIRQVPGTPTGTALILVNEQGDNMITVAAGANGRLAPHDIDDAWEAVESSDVIITQLEIPLDSVERCLRLGRQGNTLTMLNPAPMLPGVERLLPAVDIVTPNASEGALLLGLDPEETPPPGRLAELLLDKGAGAVVLTLGDAGCHFQKGDQRGDLPAFPADVVDPTGAGDVFNAILAVGLARGLPLPEAARYASAAGAIAVGRRSAQASAPTWTEIESVLATLGT